MAGVLDKQELRIYEIRKKKHKKRVAIITAFSLLVFITVVMAVVFMILNRRYANYEVIKSIERKESTSAVYYPYKNGVLRLSRDGIMAMDAGGTQLFNGMYQMKDPLMDNNGDYVVVYDKGSTGLEIINGSGRMTSVNITKPIIKAEIANQGVTAVLMEGNDENYLSYYTVDGDLILETRTFTNDDGYPIDIAISDDGQRLVTSYVALNNGNMQNKITFQNFGKIGDNYESKIVAAIDLGQTLAGDVEFINNSTVCAFGDDRFIIYSMEKVPEQIHEETLTKEIKSIFYSKEYIGLVLLNNDNESKYEIMVYDLKGEKVLSKNTNIEYKSIHISGDEIILYSNDEWYIFTLGGKQKFYYKFNEEIADVFPGKGLNRYILMKSEIMEDVKLTE